MLHVVMTQVTHFTCSGYGLTLSWVKRVALFPDAVGGSGLFGQHINEIYSGIIYKLDRTPLPWSKLNISRIVTPPDGERYDCCSTALSLTV